MPGNGGTTAEDFWADDVRPSALKFPVVGLGASAGGLAALLSFFGKVPPTPGMAFVIVLHLSPNHESHAAEILQRVTALKVMQVSGRVALEPDHVYVIAPGCRLTMDDGHLVALPRPERTRQPLEVDLFFLTLAKAHRQRAMAVVLSGTGSDGVVGLGDIKAEGGLTVAQAPTEAEHPGMPQSAIAAGRIDFVLPAEAMPAKLLDLWQNARQIRLPDAERLGIDLVRPPSQDEIDPTEVALKEIMAILLARTDNDFRCYKRGTVLRRLERRLQVTRRPSLRSTGTISTRTRRKPVCCSRTC